VQSYYENVGLLQVVNTALGRTNEAAPALIGFNWIYLGAHYLTDVLGALAAGLCWLVFCWTACETWA
jgi:undecaprenyl-diphosphatase